MSNKKKILIAPLDWGLGHATRCVSIIEELIQDFYIIIAASGRGANFLKIRFPNLKIIPFEGYNISYPSSGSMAGKMIAQMPKVLKRIKSEQEELQELIKKEKIDLVISDNRYGLYSELVPTVFITHQINIQAPFLAKSALLKLNTSYIKKYNQVWVPDILEGNDLSGELGHGNNLRNIHYIEAQSRFKDIEVSDVEKKYDYFVMISGPEPQRTSFEKAIFNLFENNDMKVAVLGGKTEQLTEETIGQITYYSHLDDVAFAQVIFQSKTVISRPGYSSIMDLMYLRAKCIFVPTKGQTEQEYLAKYHFQKSNIPYIKQANLKIDEVLNASPEALPIQIRQSSVVKRLVVSMLS